MALETTDAIALLGVVAVVAVPIIGYLRSLSKSIAAQDKRITVIETKNEIVWKALEKTAAQVLFNPHTGRKDDLLLKLANGGELDKDESQELISLLKQDLGKITRSDWKFAATIIIARMESKWPT